MPGKRRRRLTRNQRSQLIEVGTIERAGTTARQPDTMNRQRVVLADPAQVMVECAAFDQIVLGMDFEEPEIGQRIENLLKMLWFKPDTSPHRQAGVMGKIRSAARRSEERRVGKECVSTGSSRW